MQRDPIEPGSPADWLRHARSDLALASRPVAAVLFETLCFHAQQAAEKALKAVLLRKGIRFPYTHDLSRLIDLLKESGIPWPEELDRASKLSDYAIESRYPGPAEPVTPSDYEEAVPDRQVGCGLGQACRSDQMRAT